MATKGEPYRRPHRLEIDRIEARRAAANIGLGDLCLKANVGVATYYRMRGDGLAFKRHVKALAMALRTLEGDQKREAEIFPARDGAAR